MYPYQNAKPNVEISLLNIQETCIHRQLVCRHIVFHGDNGILTFSQGVEDNLPIVLQVFVCGGRGKTQQFQEQVQTSISTNLNVVTNEQNVTLLKRLS